MKILLFCENKYAVDIVRPLQDEADRQGGHEVLWYVHQPKIPDFPLKDEVHWTYAIQEAYDFRPDAVFAPGNIVPYYLSGVKCSIFHGYAAEKRDQFRIRNYYDIYMTQGPYFTQEFLKLKEGYNDFEVLETGWTRQDWTTRHRYDFDEERNNLLQTYGCDHIVLYAPTFSPRLSSLPKIKDELIKLVEKKSVLLLIKLHPLTQTSWVEEYKQLANGHANIIFEDDFAVTKYMLMADVMISDTSSTIYEMLLLDKPVITLGTVSQDPYWKDISDASQLIQAYDEVFNNKELTEKRQWIIDNYDPYTDGHCAERMLQGVADYIKRHGVPEKRKLNLWRKYVSIKTFGCVRCQ
jgi:CDP-glycerol glycerophosphotransferase (TagB/SpsB family)